MLWDNLAIVDVETTGGSPPRDRVIEIGILTVDFGVVTNRYSTLINPSRYLPPYITNITGITPDQLEHQPLFDHIAPEVFLLLQSRTFVAHNARFDLSFIKSEFSRFGVSFTPRHLCSAQLSRRLFPHHRRHSLEELILRYNLKVKNRHRALDDALAIWHFFQKISPNGISSDLHQSISSLTKRPSLPPQIPASRLDKLPQSPGVYIFSDSEGTPLYIGKSINVKERVLSHFYADLESSRERTIKEQLKDIEVINCAGNMDAELTESRLVKELQPVYNRRLRLQSEFVALTLIQNDKNYLVAHLEHLSHVNPAKDMPYALFKSLKQAKNTLQDWAKEHSLCWKLLGLESGNGPCFAHQLGDCQGACIGKETPARYNLRLIENISKYRLKQWPFQGPIAIQESNDINQKQAVHLFHHWCHLGSFQDESEFPQTPNPHHYTLNLDTYRILKRYLQKHHSKVTPLKF
jgi:DNA polymerase III subunit epsilon